MDATQSSNNEKKVSQFCPAPPPKKKEKNDQNVSGKNNFDQRLSKKKQAKKHFVSENPDHASPLVTPQTQPKMTKSERPPVPRVR